MISMNYCTDKNHNVMISNQHVDDDDEYDEIGSRF
jgi:hypothetical protein